MASNQHYYEGVNHIVKVSTENRPDEFVESVNQYIAKHGYKLLHIGTETESGALDGKDLQFQNTVAILGKKLTKKEKEALSSKKESKKFMPARFPTKKGDHK